MRSSSSPSPDSSSRPPGKSYGRRATNSQNNLIVEPTLTFTIGFFSFPSFLHCILLITSHSPRNISVRRTPHIHAPTCSYWHLISSPRFYPSDILDRDPTSQVFYKSAGQTVQINTTLIPRRSKPTDLRSMANRERGKITFGSMYFHMHIATVVLVELPCKHITRRTRQWLNLGIITVNTVNEIYAPNVEL